MNWPTIIKMDPSRISIEYVNELAKDPLKYLTDELVHYPPGWLTKLVDWSFVLETHIWFDRLFASWLFHFLMQIPITIEVDDWINTLPCNKRNYLLPKEL